MQVKMHRKMQQKVRVPRRLQRVADTIRMKVEAFLAHDAQVQLFGSMQVHVEPRDDLEQFTVTISSTGEVLCEEQRAALRRFFTEGSFPEEMKDVLGNQLGWINFRASTQPTASRCYSSCTWWVKRRDPTPPMLSVVE